MIPIAKPVMGEREAEAARRVILSRLDHAGAGGRRLRARVRRASSARRTPARCRTARRRCTWRCWPSASGPATRSSPSAIPSSPPPTPSATAARRRCSSTSSPTPSTSIPARSRPRSRRARARSCACTRSACRAIWRRSSPSRAATALPVVEDAACAIGSEILLERALGEDRQAARRHRLLLVPSRARSSPPATAA